VRGVVIVREVGARAVPGLIGELNRITAYRVGETRQRVGDQLLLALATTGDAGAVKELLGLVENDRGDDSLPLRAMDALYAAFVEPSGVAQAPPEALVPHVKSLMQIAREEGGGGAMNNRAIHLIAAMGMPACLPAFVDLLTYPISDARMARSMRWVGVQQGVRCGRAEAIVPVAESLPPEDTYERAILEKYFWNEVRQQATRHQIADNARLLLTSKSWVARVTGIELLGGLALPALAREDAGRIRLLSGDKTRLRGWLGEGTKKNPLLGAVARDTAKRLEEVADQPETGR
jgi:hypothetical protein